VSLVVCEPPGEVSGEGLEDERARAFKVMDDGIERRDAVVVSLEEQGVQAVCEPSQATLAHGLIGLAPRFRDRGSRARLAGGRAVLAERRGRRRARPLDRAARRIRRRERCAGLARRRAPREGADVSAAIVTGAGGAIGRAIARRFAAEGHRVLCVDRAETVTDVAAELEDFGARAAPCVVDLAADQAPEGVLEGADGLDGADVLVNNAGITRDGRALSSIPMTSGSS
jgi:short chain dehydrogenase